MLMSASNALKIETFFCLVNVHSISRYRSYGMGRESREIKAKTRTTINNQIGKEASIRQHAKIGRQRSLEGHAGTALRILLHGNGLF